MSKALAPRVVTALAVAAALVPVSVALAGPLVSVRSTGGNLRCEPRTCIAKVAIDETGIVTLFYAEGTVAKRIQAPAADLARLVRHAKTTPLERFRPTPFTGTCPIAYDGIETIYTVRHLGKTYVFDSCKVVVPNLAVIKATREIAFKLTKLRFG